MAYMKPEEVFLHFVQWININCLYYIFQFILMLWLLFVLKETRVK